jgi:hypothetical protein
LLQIGGQRRAGLACEDGQADAPTDNRGALGRL